MRIKVTGLAAVARVSVFTISLIVLFGTLADAQTRRPARTTKATKARTNPTPTPTPLPYLTGPEIIGRASDNTELELIGTPMRTDGTGQTAGDISPSEQSKLIEELQQRIRQLESDKRSDPDAVQKRLLLNLDILTRAEQRSESLRRQSFEMIEKENDIKRRLDAIEIDISPEMIERATAIAGSLRPEAVRESRRKQLESERTNLQSLLSEVQRNRSNLETNIRRADDLVERLRVRLERDIDDAISNDPGQDR